MNAIVKQAAFVIFASLALLGGCSQSARKAPRAQSEWVQRGRDGKLVYKTTRADDRILDFSYAGYMGGGVALPNVPVKKTIQPTGKDAAAAIQAAIDELSALPLTGGFRGAVLLVPGDFTCSATISVSA